MTITAYAIQKFAEWIEQNFNDGSCLYSDCEGRDCFDAEKAVANYKKQMKGAVNESPSILVTYDNSKSDISTIICARYRDDGEAKICTGYTGENADELYKMVSEPGYLYDHDRKIIEKFAAFYDEHSYNYASSATIAFLRKKGKDV